MATLSLVIKTRTGYSRTFVDAAVTAGSDLVTLASHGFETGDVVRLSNSGGALPAGLVATRAYYVIKVSDHTFKVATTSALATAGTAVDITAAAGGGTHTVYKEGILSDLTPTTTDPKRFATALATLVRGAAQGAIQASFDVQRDVRDPVAASGSIAITHANLDADETVTIGGVVLTAKASPTDTSTQFAIGADATADAVNLAATINEHLTLSRVLTASAGSGTVTLTAKVKGVIGNCIVMSTSDATAFGLTQLSGGTGGPAGAVSTYSFGL